MADPVDASAPEAARSAGVASSNWRDASSWRRNDASPLPPARPTGGFTQNRMSWRDRQAPKRVNEDEQQANGGPSDYAPHSRPYDRVRTIKSHQKDDDSAAKAIAEGRRIYIGNLRYQAKPTDIEDLLKANDLGHFSNIHISIDPFTGRNPSYCFVEFPDAESAQTAMATLEGKELLGREVKCRPCQPKGSGTGGKPSDAPSRWGQWGGGENEGDDQSKPKYFDRYRQDFTGKRLYVGGLPRMHDQATNFEEMTELFKDFKLEAISKRVSAHESTRELAGHHDYCFVDFATSEQAKEAMEQLNGTVFRGDRLKVSTAKGRSNKWRERDDLDKKRGFDRLEAPLSRAEPTKE